MDLVSHIFIGASVGQLTIGKKAGTKAMFWGALAGVTPDFDVIFQSLFSPVESVFFHRGITHSLILWLILSFLFAVFCWKKILIKKNISYKEWLSLWGLGWFSHLFVDLFNTYGTGYFLPFNGIRLSFDTINVLDILFTIPLLVSFILLFVIRRNSNCNAIAIAGLACSFFYLSYTIYNKIHFDNFAREELTKHGINYKRLLTSPLPLSNFAWMILAEDTDSFWMGTYFMTEGGKIEFRNIPKNHHLVNFQNAREFKRLQDFTKGYYVIEKNNEKTILSDARFTSLANVDSNTKIEFVLQFEITEKDGDFKIKRAIPNRKLNFKTFSNYYHRLFKSRLDDL